MAHALAPEVHAKLQASPLSSADLQLLLGQSQPVMSRILSELTEQGDIVALGRSRARIYAATDRIPGLSVAVPTYRVGQLGEAKLYGGLVPLSSDRMAFVDPRGNFEIFSGLPWFFHDMRPQGFLGRLFTRAHPELFGSADGQLDMTPRVSEWSDRDVLHALSVRGEDCVGDLILGEESLRRFKTNVSHPPLVVDPQAAYPEMAIATLLHGSAGSSAGGEQPKFLASVRRPDGQVAHVLVKFSGPTDSAVDERTRDLLLAENQAQIAIAESPFDVVASASRVIRAGGRVFLEVDRFDRIGESGRRGTLSLGVLDAQFLGRTGSWSSLADGLEEQELISPADADRIRFLYYFGEFIGNTDMHPWNLSFFRPPDLQARVFTLAPAYDMLPMTYAPVSGEIVERDDRTYCMRSGSGKDVDIQREALRCALLYWQNVAALNDISDSFKTIVARNLKNLQSIPSKGANQFLVSRVESADRPHHRRSHGLK
jgi:hypothetical protein